MNKFNNNIYIKIATVKTCSGIFTENFKINKELSQGYFMSPRLFKIDPQQIFTKWRRQLEPMGVAVVSNKPTFYSLFYADDQ